jgi:hypothetical protein
MLCPLRAVDIAWSTASTTFVIASPRLAVSPVFVVSSSRVTAQIQAFEFSSSKMTYCLPRYSIANTPTNHRELKNLRRSKSGSGLLRIKWAIERNTAGFFRLRNVTRIPATDPASLSAISSAPVAPV